MVGAKACRSLLDDLRSNDLARTAPCGEAVQDHEGVLLSERLVECRLATIRIALV
jgi:hypothetical protein